VQAATRKFHKALPAHAYCDKYNILLGVYWLSTGNCSLCALAAVVCERMGSMYCWSASSFWNKKFNILYLPISLDLMANLGNINKFNNSKEGWREKQHNFFANSWAYAFGKCFEWINYAQVCSNAPLSPEYASRKLHLNSSISVFDASVNALFAGIFLILVLWMLYLPGYF